MSNTPFSGVMLTQNGRVFLGGAGTDVPALAPGGGSVAGATDYKVLTYGAIVRLITVMIAANGGTGGGGVNGRTDAQIRALADEAIAAAGLSTDAERMALENALRALIQTNTADIQGNLNNLQSISTAVNQISTDLAGLAFVKDISQNGNTLTVTFRDDSTRELTVGGGSDGGGSGGGGGGGEAEHVAGFVRAFGPYDAAALLAMSLAAKAARDAGDDGAQAVWIVGRDQIAGGGVPAATTLEDRTGGRAPTATGGELLFKAGSVLQVVYVDDESFTLALLSVPMQPAAELDYVALAKELFSDSSRALAPAQDVAFAAAAGNGNGNPAVSTSHTEDLGEGDLTAEEKTAITDAAETSFVSGSVEWNPGPYSGFPPESGTFSVLVGDAANDDMISLGTITLNENQSGNFSFAVTPAAVAKGVNVRLRMVVETRGGAMPDNVFRIGEIILHEKGSAVARIFALAKSAVSGMFATVNSALASVRESVQTNAAAIMTNAQNIAANLAAINILRSVGRQVVSEAVLAWQNGLRKIHMAGQVVFHYPYDGFFGAPSGATTATAKKAGTLDASTIGRGPATDYPNTLIITPLNQIHKVLVIKNTKGADQTLIFMQVLNIYGNYANLPFFQRYTAEDGKKYYRFVNLDGAQEAAYTNTEIEARNGDSLAISLTAAARDPTAEEFVISLRRAGEAAHAQNTITAPAGTLARARFNRVLVPDDGAGNYRNCEDVDIVHHQGVYVSHSVLGLIDLTGANAYDSIATEGAGSDYLQQTEKVDYTNGLRVRGVEVTPGGTLNYRINAYVRVAHGTDTSAGISLTSGGVWDKDTRTFTTLPTTDFSGATVLAKLPANFLNSQVYDFYVFHRLFVDGESGVTGDEWNPGGQADRNNDGTAPALTPKSVTETHLADGAVSNRTIGAGAVGLLKLSLAVLARMAPALAGQGGKFLAANAGETALEFVDAPAGGGGGGTNSYLIRAWLRVPKTTGAVSSSALTSAGAWNNNAAAPAFTTKPTTSTAGGVVYDVSDLPPGAATDGNYNYHRFQRIFTVGESGVSAAAWKYLGQWNHIAPHAKTYVISAYLRIGAGDVPLESALTSAGTWSDNDKEFTVKPTENILDGAVYDDKDLPAVADRGSQYDYWEFQRYWIEGETSADADEWSLIGKVDQDAAASGGGAVVATDVAPEDGNVITLTEAQMTTHSNGTLFFMTGNTRQQGANIPISIPVAVLAVMDLGTVADVAADTSTLRLWGGGRAQWRMADRQLTASGGGFTYAYLIG